MVCEPDLIPRGEAKNIKNNVINGNNGKGLPKEMRMGSQS